MNLYYGKLLCQIKNSSFPPHFLRNEIEIQRNQDLRRRVSKQKHIPSFDGYESQPRERTQDIKHRRCNEANALIVSQFPQDKQDPEELIQRKRKEGDRKRKRKETQLA